MRRKASLDIFTSMERFSAHTSEPGQKDDWRPFATSADAREGTKTSSSCRFFPGNSFTDHGETDPKGPPPRLISMETPSPRFPANSPPPRRCPRPALAGIATTSVPTSRCASFVGHFRCPNVGAVLSPERLLRATVPGEATEAQASFPAATPECTVPPRRRFLFGTGLMAKAPWVSTWKDTGIVRGLLRLICRVARRRGGSHTRRGNRFRGRSNDKVTKISGRDESGVVRLRGRRCGGQGEVATFSGP